MEDPISTTPDHSQNSRGVQVEHSEANLTGAYVTALGVVVFVVSMFLDWAGNDADDVTYSGYESDSVIPFAAFVGIGLVVALLYAGSRASRNQHRGLSLASMAVGLGATLFSLAWMLDLPGAFGQQSDYSFEIGAVVGLIGAAVWSIGSGLLAKEDEGDETRDVVHNNRGNSNPR